MNHSGIRQEDGRGVLILILGILSITTLGPFTGIPAWIMANTDLKKIELGIIPRSEKSFTKAGKIMGIIGTFFLGVVVFLGIGTVVFINMIANG
ncbi:MAG: hypothetical protein U5J95_11570 [Balneolaceae bacterium]|nr:hypothetical protein [Balneolaceae bacterium]